MERLIASIIERCIDDYVNASVELHNLKKAKNARDEIYRKYMRRKKRRPDYTLKDAEADRKNRIDWQLKIIDDCERFLKSEWLKTMTEIDGDFILNMCRKKTREKIYNL